MGSAHTPGDGAADAGGTAAAAPVGASADAEQGGGRRTAASERHADLVRLAAELFARNGVRATTVREIAHAAGILSGSLYHHFDSKETIVDEVLSACTEDLLRAHRAAASSGAAPREMLSALVGACCSALAKHRAALAVVHNDWNHLSRQRRFDYLAAAEREIRGIWVRAIEEGQAEGALRGGVEPALAYRMIRDALLGAARWYRPDGPLTPAALADRYAGLLLDGLGARRTARPLPGGPGAAGGAA